MEGQSKKNSRSSNSRPIRRGKKRSDSVSSSTQDDNKTRSLSDLTPSETVKLLAWCKEQEKRNLQPEISPKELLEVIPTIKKPATNNSAVSLVAPLQIDELADSASQTQSAPNQNTRKSTSDSPPKKKQKIPKYDWDPDTPGAFIQHSAVIYEKIKIPKICFSIIDTPAFQRLNNIKQLGVVDRIYRQATHTRFEHSLGVANLARRVMKKLRKKRSDITGNDMLCVIIAGLCHDLGHGPFSHCFGPIMREFNSEYNYRKLSTQIFDYILETEPNAKATLSQYLDDDDFQFIRDMINPPEEFFNNNTEWILKSRPASKQFLYEIINNIYHGLDVDKLDYLVRDSYHTGVDGAIGSNVISRFLNGIDVENINGEERITFAGKLSDNIPDVFNSRKSLFAKAYYHKTVYPMEYQIQKALRLAAPHLKIRGTDKKFRVLKDILTEPIDIRGYINLDDHITSLIENSEIEHPDMDEARQCIENIERRTIHTIILKIAFCNGEWDEKLDIKVKNEIDNVKNKNPKLKKEGEIIYKTRHYDFGQGPNVDPSDKILYKARSNVEETPKIMSSRNLKSESAIFVYGPHDISSSDADAFYREMKNCLERHEITKELEFLFKESN